jgi:hypothetical protein
VSLLPPPAEGEVVLDQEERDGRAYRVAVRPSFTEGQYLGLGLRCWGPGHWTEARGEPHHYTKRGDARDAGQRWLDEGKR